MSELALERRRLRRRVADDKRKRAPRACDRCKARKSRCIESTPGTCRRCEAKHLTCIYDDRHQSPGHTDASPLPMPARHSAVRNGTTPGDDNISINSHQADRIMWPRFLSRLREAFSLDVQSTPEAHDMMAMQASISGPRNLLPAELSRLRRAIDAFPPRPVADYLLAVCIRHGTDSFFYFDQAHFLHEIDEFYNDQSSPLRGDIGFIGLALAAFALGSQWTPMERPSEGPTPSSAGDHDPGTLFHSNLKTLVPDLIERPCLRSIQAFYVMGVYLMPTSAVGSSYVYIGLALRKALAFDLHQSADEASIDERERDVRNRLWWSIWSLERITALKLNRARSVDIEHVTVPLPTPVASLDQGDSRIFDNVQHQIAMARLVKILDGVTDVGTRPSATAVRRLEASLKDWKHSLPLQFKLANINTRDSSYRAVLHLYLNYYYAWIAMGKVSVVTVVRDHLRQNLSGQGLMNAPALDAAVRDLSYACSRAASKILRLFEMLSNTGNITRFSFTDFQGCSIATIVTLLSGIQGRDSGYEGRVTFGLDCLRKMAAGNMTAKVGVRFVEALQAIADEAVMKLRHAEHDHQHEVGLDSGAAEYTRWAQWLSRAENEPQSLGSPSTIATNVAQPAVMLGAPPTTDNSNLPMTPSVRDAAMWDHPTNDSLLPPLAPPSAVAPALSTFTARPMFEHSNHNGGYGDDFLPSSLYGDDQNFLMGLTGLDVLDFSELTTPL
ncbi:fungal-specific transcription factor domain-containing protein [Emericellopsis atlantica]|uniref:Fungal-specific transcription factor domain-containing protein n=1 Tax=Emericellopsis atlantica TaxID=2614577 RepID=A0A9P7ZEG0_9HYPO|nr:fungal-specific transcription factor domain-containing protein [Emericellopsis atlantica]KAG9250221.1 fungal-specific transcription factor domain-containing protein [Emericellopsis atlantica]